MSEHDPLSCFLEAHFYSAGLRIEPFGGRARPSWSPEADSVGFRDEFELNQGDAAIEMRRFEISHDQITWVGVFYRSKDAKLGDRSNHAGVGAWYQNAVPFDFSHLLHGLDLLAQELAREMSPVGMDKSARRFETEFLPQYAMGTETLEPSTGFPYAASGLVETQIETVFAPSGIAACRPLTDFLAFKSVGETEPVPPRLLVRASSQPTASPTIADDFEFASNMLKALPLIRQSDRDRIAAGQTKVAAAEAMCAQLQRSLAELEAESTELKSLRDDPQLIVMRRLDAIHEDVRSLGATMHHPATVPVATYPSQWRSGGRSSPVSRPASGASRHDVEPGNDTGWIILAAGVLLVFILVLGALLALDRWFN